MQGLHVQLGDVYCVFLCKYSMRTHEVVSTKPPTPEQARIKTMQAQVKRAQAAVKQERLRQQQARLNQQRSKLAGM